MISPVWKRILKIWDTLYELIQIEVQCSSNYFKIALSQEAGASRNNIDKEPQKPCSKSKKIFIKGPSINNVPLKSSVFNSLSPLIDIFIKCGLPSNRSSLIATTSSVLNGKDLKPLEAQLARKYTQC